MHAETLANILEVKGVVPEGSIKPRETVAEERKLVKALFGASDGTLHTTREELVEYEAGLRGH